MVEGHVQVYASLVASISNAPWTAEVVPDLFIASTVNKGDAGQNSFWDLESWCIDLTCTHLVSSLLVHWHWLWFCHSACGAFCSTEAGQEPGLPVGVVFEQGLVLLWKNLLTC